MNPLLELRVLGQSIWLDNISRGLLRSGGLARLAEKDGISGVTSNPSIFEKAISHGSDYDEAMRELMAQGASEAEIFDAVAVEDIQAATDVLRPVFDRTGGQDGYVSIEVSPKLAHDTQGTIEDARRLFAAVNRPNVMVKVPATQEGVPAIRQLLAEGININITLMFSMEHYEAVAQAYIDALEERAQKGLPIDGLASVASFFVSRVDTLVDGILERKMREEGPDAAKSAGLRGKAAIANSKLVYQRFKELFGSERFQALAAKGARVQRVLWASTSTKNPAYSDVMYVETLIGPDTINTLPDETIEAYRDHGKPRLTVEEGVDEARATFEDLASLGIDMNAVGEQLSVEGVDKFSKSFDKLYAVIAGKRAQLAAQAGPPSAAPSAGDLDSQTLALGDVQPAVEARLERFQADDLPRRLWKGDGSLWKSEPDRQKMIADRLGWLTIAEKMQGEVDGLVAFAGEIQAAGFQHVVLLGMGGSSLAPEVYGEVLGAAPGRPELIVLDSTDPASVLGVRRKIDPARTLFLVSSKSGGTTETNSFFKYWMDQVRPYKGDESGQNFVAITDPGTSLEKLAHDEHFRRVFPGPQDVGGRFSALTFFGLAPAALIGVDVRGLLERATRMASACGPDVPVAQNPGLVLGAALGELHEAGCDKLTFITSPGLTSFGYWVEQLIAESTGKEGKGIVPIESEALPSTSDIKKGVYGDDRVFVYMRLGGEDSLGRKVAALEAAGHPVIRIDVRDGLDLGQEFFRWEMATAAAGVVLGIDPFDQPNVAESKDNTKRLLDQYARRGEWTDRGGVPVGMKKSQWQAVLAELAGKVKPGDYVALQAYLPRTPAIIRALNAIRLELRDGLGVATTVGFGPRFLHSTGQLHKGGANNGVFIQITAGAPRDVAVPGEPYTFGTLINAQASGDLASLKSHRRRAARIHLGDDVTGGLRELRGVVGKVVKAWQKDKAKAARGRK